MRHVWGRAGLHWPHLSTHQKNLQPSRSSLRPASSLKLCNCLCPHWPHPLLDSFDNSSSQRYWTYSARGSAVPHFLRSCLLHRESWLSSLLHVQCQKPVTVVTAAQGIVGTQVTGWGVRELDFRRFFTWHPFSSLPQRRRWPYHVLCTDSIA